MVAFEIVKLPKHPFMRIWCSPFARNVALVATGTAGAQVISMAFAPLITRIYGPEAFGVLGTFMALAAIATPVAALAYPIAMVLPKEDQEALGLARLSAYLSLAISILMAIALWSGGDWLVGILDIKSIGAYILFIPLVMVFSAWVQIGHQWLIRKKQFSLLARIEVIQSLLMNSAKTGFGWFNPVAAVLISIAALSPLLHAIMLYTGAKRRYTGAISQPTTKLKTIKSLAIRHRDFPLYRTPQNLINAASQSLPILMLAAFFGPVAAGFYTLGKMVMGMPSMLIGKAVNDVFYPRITDAAHNGENLPRLIIRATGALLVIGIVPFGLVMLLGPWLFSLVFGGEWVMAGEYARWLALFFLFNFINKPSVAAVPVLGIQRGLLIYELFSTGGKIFGLIAGFYWFGSDLVAVALFSITGIVAYSVMMLWILWHAMYSKINAKTS